jgi:hypothetical protein
MDAAHFQTLRALIVEAENRGKLESPVGVEGLSGDKLIGVLQRLARHQEAVAGGCYCEIGVFQGLTLLSVAKVLERTTAFGIDNFSQFDPRKTNRDIIRQRMAANAIRNAVLIDMDYEDALLSLDRHLRGRRVGMLFVDGPHDYRSQLMCLLLARPHLSDMAVVVVDDCNYRHVRQANSDFLASHADFKLLFEAYTKQHPEDMAPQELALARAGWWNGVNVLARDPENVLQRAYPFTPRTRALYEQEHLVHAAKHGYLAPHAVQLITALARLRLFAAGKELGALLKKARSADRTLMGGYTRRNTFSAGLPAFALNPSLASSPAPPRSGEPPADTPATTV